jgi:hypothetical protein
VLGFIISPYARPLLPVETFLAYQSALILKPPSNEGHNTELPQFYSDMFGWEEMAKKVSKVYQMIPKEERSRTVVYCSNYGKAGAMEYFSKKYPLPKVICPHNSYWYWWDEVKNVSTIIIIGGNIEDHLQSLEQVDSAAFYETKYAMPYENNLTIFVGTGLKRLLEEIRQRDKFFF